MSMKPIRKFAAVSVLLASACISHAAVTAYEPFNYAAGTLANNTPSTGVGFTGKWTVSAFPQIVNTVLTYPGLTVVNRAY